LHIIRDRRAVVGWKLRSILDHAGHRAAGGVVIGRRPGFEEVGDVLLAPIAYSFLGDVRHPALAFRIGSPGKALRADDAAKEMAGAVTLRAMTKAVHEIGAAIPLRRAPGVCGERLAVHEQHFPDADVAPDVERKRTVMIAHFAADLGKRFQISKEIADIAAFRMLI